MPGLSNVEIKSPFRVDQEGVVRIGNTRVTLDTLVASYRDGNTAEEIVEQYPSLALAEVHAALALYLMNTAEVDAYLLEREANAAKTRELVESISNQQEMRQRLLARKAFRKTGS